MLHSPHTRVTAALQRHHFIQHRCCASRRTTCKPGLDAVQMKRAEHSCYSRGPDSQAPRRMAYCTPLSLQLHLLNLPVMLLQLTQNVEELGTLLTDLNEGGCLAWVSLATQTPMRSKQHHHGGAHRAVQKQQAHAHMHGHLRSTWGKHGAAPAKSL